MRWGLVVSGLLLLTACDSKPAATDVPQARPELPTAPPLIGPEQHVLALGDSLFAGYGLKREESYPARLEAALRGRGINARIVNAGVSGDTTAAGRARLEFTLNSGPKPDLVLICLGGNDLLRGLPPEQNRANLDAILAELDRRGIKAMLMGMLAPPNLGADYAGKFNAIYPSLARQHHAALEPFILQAITGHPELQQADHIHPTAQGVSAMVAASADTVAKALR